MPKACAKAAPCDAVPRDNSRCLRNELQYRQSYPRFWRWASPDRRFGHLHLATKSWVFSAIEPVSGNNASPSPSGSPRSITTSSKFRTATAARPSSRVVTMSDEPNAAANASRNHGPSWGSSSTTRTRTTFSSAVCTTWFQPVQIAYDRITARAGISAMASRTRRWCRGTGPIVRPLHADRDLQGAFSLG